MLYKRFFRLFIRFVFFLFFFQSLFLKAENTVQYTSIYLKNYNGSEGMPGSQVNYLMQDSKGFIWIATDKGVSRFDGQHFKNFTSADGLESNEIFRIAEDHYHRIFFYCDNYKICFYENGHIYKLAPKEKVLLPPFGNFFFNRYNELCINYGLSTQCYRFPELKAQTHPINHNVVYGEHGSQILVTASDRTIIRRMLANDKLDTVNATYDKPYRVDVQGDYLIMVTKKNLQAYRKKDGLITSVNNFTFESNINAINSIDGNTYAVTTFRQGTFIINCITGKRENYLDKYITTHTLMDREKNIWFGTYDNGLFLSPNTKTHIINTAGGLANNNVQKLAVFNDYIFAGHILSGVSCIKRIPGVGFYIDKLNITQWRSDFNRITSLLPVGNRFMVLGTDNGIWQLIASRRPVPEWKLRLYSVGPVKDIVQRTDSTCYLTHRTLRVIFDWQKKYGWYDIDSLRVTSLAWFKNHPLVGTLYGLYRLDLTKTDNHFKMTRLLKANGINAVKCLAANTQVCAIGTEDKGVFLLSKGPPLRFNAPLICSGNIRRLIWTEENTLWVCTSNGASVISFSDNYKKYRIIRLTTSDGLPSDDIADVVKKDQDYYIATDQGIAVTSNIWNSDRPKPLLLDDDTSGKKKRFTYGQPVLFNCVALSYKSLGKIQYRFRLQGVDRNWTEASSGEKRFDLLPPGSYELDVMAVDRFNNQSPLLVYKFTVLPLWYQQVWLQIIAVLCIIFVCFLLIRKYYLSIIGLQKKDYENALALQRERQRISSEVHDDLGASISGIKLQTETLSKRVNHQPVFKEIDAIHEAITDIAKQIRLIVWSLDTENDEVSSLINFVQKQATKIFETGTIKFHKNIFDGQTETTIGGEKRRQVYLLVKEVLNNIVKHSEAQNAYLEITLNRRKLYINIRDDGRGFVPDRHNLETMGMRNIYARAKQLNADLKIDSAIGKGTLVILKVNL